VGQIWRETGRKLVIVDLDTIDREEVAALEELRARFGEGVAVLGLRGESNAQGAVELGLVPNGGGKQLVSRCRSGDLRALVLFGLGSTDQAPPVRLRSKPDFLVVVDAVASALSKRADVVLPGAFWMEDEGTLTNSERRIQQMAPALVAPGGRANWEVVAALADALGKRWHYSDAESVFTDLAHAVGWDVNGYEGLRPWGVPLSQEREAAISK